MHEMDLNDYVVMMKIVFEIFVVMINEEKIMALENNINDQDVLLLFVDMRLLVVDMLLNEMHYLIKKKNQDKNLVYFIFFSPNKNCCSKLKGFDFVFVDGV